MTWFAARDYCDDTRGRLLQIQTPQAKNIVDSILGYVNIYIKMYVYIKFSLYFYLLDSTPVNHEQY